MNKKQHLFRPNGMNKKQNLFSPHVINKKHNLFSSNVRIKKHNLFSPNVITKKQNLRSPIQWYHHVLVCLFAAVVCSRAVDTFLLFDAVFLLHYFVTLRDVWAHWSYIWAQKNPRLSAFYHSYLPEKKK